MKLPKNGKVIVIDNEPNEAAPLLQVLSKNRIPHVYFTGETDFLPREGEVFEDVRVLFLDINLTNNAVYESTIGQLKKTLLRVVKPGTPYIAAIWSNNQNNHEDLINDLFGNRAPQIAPISRILLSKSDFFQYDPEVGYTLDPDNEDVLGDLEQRINNCLNEVDSAKLLIRWENSISEASTETVVGISKIVDNDSFWNDNLKHIYYKLAHAQLGKTIINHNNQDLQKAALNTLTSSFNDQVEMRISDIEINPEIDISRAGRNFYRTINNSQVRLLWNDFTYYLYIDGTQKSQNKLVSGLKANNTPAEQQIAADLKSVYGLISPKLNAELLISKSPKVVFHPGNVYKKQVVGRKKRKLLKTYFPNIKDKVGNSNTYKLTDLSGFQFVEVECTPVCDYSQSKRLRYRFLPGVLYEVNVDVSLDKNLDSIYREIPPFEFKGKIYQLVFDYRLFKAVNKEDEIGFTESDFMFRLKTELLVDIQARISSHVNRPGIVTVS